jgi:peroxiredoxin
VSAHAHGYAALVQSYSKLPRDLPVPIDDGACDHLLGVDLPDLTLISTEGRPVNLRDAAEGLLVLYLYPRTARPGEALPPGWDSIPGARGCTPQSCSFRDHAGHFSELGATVMGVSSQTTDEQLEFAKRKGIPFTLLSDPDLRLATALQLPTFEAGGMRLFKRVTLVAEQANIVKVFYPVYPPDRNAEDVIDWLSARPRR